MRVKLYLLCALSSLVITSNLVFAGTEFNPDKIKYETDEVMLLQCQEFGRSLYNKCVKSGAGDPRDCPPRKLAYTACVKILNTPAKLVMAKGSYHPYSPCSLEISYVILPEICSEKM